MWLEMIYEGDPVPADRARVNKRSGSFYTPTKYSEYKRALAGMIKARFPKYATFTTAQKALLTTKDKKAIMARRYGLLLLVYERVKKGDQDNYLKAVQDGLQDAGVILNDSQVDLSFVGKLQSSSRPRIEFVLFEIVSIMPVTDLILNAYNKVRTFFSACKILR